MLAICVGWSSRTLATTSTSGPARMKSVAPNSRASVSFEATVSIAKMRLAPSPWRAWITLSPTPPTPNDRARVADARGGAVPDGADAGEHAAADEARGVEVDVGDRSCTHCTAWTTVNSEKHDVAAKFHASSPATVKGWPRSRCSCGSRRGAGLAPLARAAERHRVQHHVVARRDVGDRLPDRVDDARAFVAEHRGRRPGDRAVDDAQVAVAQTRPTTTRTLTSVGPGARTSTSSRSLQPSNTSAFIAFAPLPLRYFRFAPSAASLRPSSRAR